MSDQYFYARGSRQNGPISLEQLRTMIARGEFKRSDRVWRTGMDTWDRAGNCAEVFEGMPPDLVSEDHPEHELRKDYRPTNNPANIPSASVENRPAKALPVSPQKTRPVKQVKLGPVQDLGSVFTQRITASEGLKKGPSPHCEAVINNPSEEEVCWRGTKDLAVTTKTCTWCGRENDNAVMCCCECGSSEFKAVNTEEQTNPVVRKLWRVLNSKISLSCLLKGAAGRHRGASRNSHMGAKECPGCSKEVGGKTTEADARAVNLFPIVAFCGMAILLGIIALICYLNNSIPKPYNSKASHLPPGHLPGVTAVQQAESPIGTTPGYPCSYSDRVKIQAAARINGISEKEMEEARVEALREYDRLTKRFD